MDGIGRHSSRCQLPELDAMDNQVLFPTSIYPKGVTGLAQLVVSKPTDSQMT